jgi:hypothetical protein
LPIKAVLFSVIVYRARCAENREIMELNIMLFIFKILEIVKHKGAVSYPKLVDTVKESTASCKDLTVQL